MRGMKLILTVPVVVAMAVVSGCATGGPNRLTQFSYEQDLNESQCFVGQTTKQVIQKLGQPQQRANKKGKQIWEYKKPSEQHTTLNTASRAFCLGFCGENDAPYVDVLTLTFINKIVKSQEYNENVLNISLPGLSMLSSGNKAAEE